MSAGRQQTAEELAYYNSAAFKAQQEAARAEAERKLKYTTTARWMRGETVEEFQENAKANGPITPHKEYLHTQTVERATIRRLEIERRKEYEAIVSHLPKPIAEQFRIGEDTPTTIPGMPHLGSLILGRMLHVAPDGSRSVVHVCKANFTPGSIEPDGHRFKEIPAQYDGVKNRAVVYLVGQKINPDGSRGGVDTRYLRADGKAQMTHDLGDVQAAILKIGRANLAVMKHETAKAAAASSETSQILQSEKDRIRAVQAQLHAREQAARQQQPEQDVGRSYGRR